MRYLFKLIFILIIFSNTNILCFSQQVYSNKTEHHQKHSNKKPEPKGRLDINNPAVYITFDHAGKRKPLYNSDSDEGIWLRLHNNTIWSIGFRAYGASEGEDVGVQYDVEKISTDNFSKEKVPIGNYSHVSTLYHLNSGDSIVFSLPREHLGKGMAIYVSIYFEWEDLFDFTSGRETKHHVYFRSTALPKYLLIPEKAEPRELP